MKTKTLMLFCILCVAGAIILGSCAIMGKTDKYVQYAFIDETHSGLVDFYTAEKRWIDDEGNIWSHVKDTVPMDKHFDYLIFYRF
jgi:hypothetical protein